MAARRVAALLLFTCGAAAIECEPPLVAAAGEKCQCPPQYYGQQCELQLADKLRDKLPLLCSEHGTKIGGRCRCKTGYRGAKCQLRHCGEHGSLVGTDSTAQCYCNEGWSGEACTKPRCLDVGTMYANENACTCHGNYAGLLCDRCARDHYGPSCAAETSYSAPHRGLKVIFMIVVASLLVSLCHSNARRRWRAAAVESHVWLVPTDVLTRASVIRAARFDDDDSDARRPIRRQPPPPPPPPSADAPPSYEHSLGQSELPPSYSQAILFKHQTSAAAAP